MPKAMIERHIPGFSTLTATSLQAVTTSNPVVVGEGEPCNWHCSYIAGDTIHRVHKAGSAEAVRRYAGEGCCPACTVTMIVAAIGPHAAGQ